MNLVSKYLGRNSVYSALLLSIHSYAGVPAPRFPDDHDDPRAFPSYLECPIFVPEVSKYMVNFEEVGHAG